MLRFLTTKSDVDNATEDFLGSYGSKWRLQRRAAFSGRTTSGTDMLYQTTFVGSLGECASEIMRVCTLRPKLTCTNMAGPQSDIIAALAEIGVHYADGRLSGAPIVSDKPVEMTPAERRVAIASKRQEAESLVAAYAAEQAALDDAVRAQATEMIANAQALLASVPALPAPAETIEPLPDTQRRAIGSNGKKEIEKVA